MAKKDDSVAMMMIADLEQRITNALQEAGISFQEAKMTAISLVDAVQAEWGGIGMYLPKGLARKLSTRDQKIYNEFGGDNFTPLARKYNLTERQIRSIVAKGRVIDLRQRQSDLFAAGDEQ